MNMQMNKKQKRILIIVVIILAVMLIYPPYHFKRGGYERSLGYHFINDKWIIREEGGTIDIKMLMIQYLFTITIGGISFFVSKGKDEKMNDNRENIQNE